jgi:hypothetical protein
MNSEAPLVWLQPASRLVMVITRQKRGEGANDPSMRFCALLGAVPPDIAARSDTTSVMPGGLL